MLKYIYYYLGTICCKIMFIGRPFGWFYVPYNYFMLKSVDKDPKRKIWKDKTCLK